MIIIRYHLNISNSSNNNVPINYTETREFFLYFEYQNWRNLEFYTNSFTKLALTGIEPYVSATVQTVELLI